MAARALCLLAAAAVAGGAPRAPVGNSIHLRFRETPVWLACHMHDSPAFTDPPPANDSSAMPDVVFTAYDSDTRYECRFETSEAQRAELRRREMLPVGAGIVMMKYEDDKWFSGDLPPFDCLTTRTALPRWVFDLEARRPPATEAEAALCSWNRHRLRGWRGLNALAPLAIDFPDLPTVTCAMAPPTSFSAGTFAFTLPGLTDAPLVCIFRTYRDFPGLAEAQAQRQLEVLRSSLEASLQPHPIASVRCERIDAASSAPPATSKRTLFTVRASGGYGARCRLRG